MQKISRRSFFSQAAAFSVTMALAPRTRAAEKPNVLFIAVDDLKPELGCYGSSHIKSPRIDELADSGMCFLRNYCQQAVCSPSRTSIMTGLRPDATKVWDLNTHFRDHVPDVVTVSQHFRQQGYRAMGMGKIYHGGFQDDASWDEWVNVTSGAAWLKPENQALIAELKRKAKEEGLTGKAYSRTTRGPALENEDVPDEAYRDGKIARAGAEAIRKLKGEPFFLAVGFLKPHLPFNSPKRYWDLYDHDSIKTAAYQKAPAGAPDYVGTSWGELRHYSGIPAQGGLDPEFERQLIHAYYACVSYTDANVGVLLDALEEEGLTENTIVVLWGDHGWHLGDHDYWCKHTNFEQATRSPLIIRNPGMKHAGHRSQAMTEFVDVYPTLCELAGLPLPDHLQGVSLAPLMEDPDRKWKQASISQYPRGQRMGYSLRTPRYRYTRWVDRDDHSKVDAVELYDYEKDPLETKNFAEAPEYGEVLQRLGILLDGGWENLRPE